MHVAIVFEDGKAIRAFKDEKCIFNAYKWAHRHFCLADEGYPIHKLPDYLEVKYYPLMTDEQFRELVA